MLKHLALGLFRTSLIGVLDVLEYKYFNPRIFFVHNFPDIVPYMKPGAWAAFMSGVKCAWFLFLPVSLLYSFVGVNPASAFKISLLEFGLSLVLMIKNRKSDDIFLNHKCFYGAFAVGGLTTLFV